MTAAQTMARPHRRIQPGRVLMYIILILGVIVMLFPFIWMLLCSFKSNIEVIQIPPTFFPKEWVADGYIRAWERNIVTPYINTAITSVCITVLQLVTASMAAFAFARLRFPGRNVLFLVVLSMMMVPQNMTMIPKFHIVRALGGYDKLIGIIMPNFISINVTFFIRQNFLSFPSELEEAAKIDGCSIPRIFLQILLPLSTSILTAMGIMVLLWAWNDLLWPTIIITRETNRTLSMFIALCKGQYITDYGFLMAASALAVVPMIIVYIIFQRAFVDSITMTVSKADAAGRPPKSQSYRSKEERLRPIPRRDGRRRLPVVCVTKKLQLDLPYTFRYAAADGCGAATMGKVDKKAGTATSSALIFFVNSI